MRDVDAEVLEVREMFDFDASAGNGGPKLADPTPPPSTPPVEPAPQPEPSVTRERTPIDFVSRNS